MELEFAVLLLELEAFAVLKDGLLAVLALVGNNDLGHE
jgi:hypothetical protein